MSLMEERKNDLIIQIIAKLDKVYQKELVCNRVCYMSKGGIPFSPFKLEDGAYGIEYANGEECIRQGIFEDGDIFYVEDYDCIDDMVKDMCREIDDE